MVRNKRDWLTRIFVIKRNIVIQYEHDDENETNHENIISQLYIHIYQKKKNR